MTKQELSTEFSESLYSRIVALEHVVSELIHESEMREIGRDAHEAELQMEIAKIDALIEGEDLSPDFEEYHPCVVTFTYHGNHEPIPVFDWQDVVIRQIQRVAPLTRHDLIDEEIAAELQEMVVNIDAQIARDLAEAKS